MMLHGDVPAEVRPLFFGASLEDLRKKMGGVWPTAVGCTLRCLVMEYTRRLVSDEMASFLGPKQLGFGVRSGAEAVAMLRGGFC